jgi:hypothetical protein
MDFPYLIVPFANRSFQEKPGRTRVVHYSLCTRKFENTYSRRRSRTVVDELLDDRLAHGRRADEDAAVYT